MVGEHGRYTMVAVFTDVLVPERLAWVVPATGMRTTSTLADLGDGRTELVVHQRHLPEAAQTADARAGFLSSLDELDAHLDRRRREQVRP